MQKELLDTDAQELGARLARMAVPRYGGCDENVNHPGKATEAKRLACVLFLAREIHKDGTHCLMNEKNARFYTSPSSEGLGVVIGCLY